MKCYTYINVLSLDVAAGACVCAAFIAHILEVTLAWQTLATLGLTVWLIYTIDHLRDAWVTKHPPATLRHRFHQRYRKPLLTVSVIVMGMIALLLFYLPPTTLYYGIWLIALVLLYFILIYSLPTRPSYHKELMIAVLYAAGVFLPPISISTSGFSPFIVILFAQFALMALSNLLIFSLFEIDTDVQDNFSSLVRVVGEKVIIVSIKGMIIFQVVVAIVLLLQGIMGMVPLFFLCMSLLLGCIIFFDRYFRVGHRYRLVGDAVFLIPIFFLW